jgi:hypothetical protein
MSKCPKQLSLAATIVIILACLTWGLSSTKTDLSQSGGGSSTASKTNKQTIIQKNPCWFRLPEGIEKTREGRLAYERYMSRQTFGYPEDISLSEAVRIFNEEAFCSGPDPKRPPLTEDEVMAGAIDEMSKGGGEPVDPALKVTSAERQASIKRIWKDKVMPKGSLLGYAGYYDLFDQDRPEEGTIIVNCWKIYLYLNLDKNPIEGGFLKPDQICLIRKSCFNTEHKPSRTPK